MKREIKTVKGYISAAKRLEANTTQHLKGYEKLTAEQKLLLGEICASIGNILGEFEEWKKLN